MRIVAYCFSVFLIFLGVLGILVWFYTDEVSALQIQFFGNVLVVLWGHIRWYSITNMRSCIYEMPLLPIPLLFGSAGIALYVFLRKTRPTPLMQRGFPIEKSS